MVSSLSSRSDSVRGRYPGGMATVDFALAMGEALAEARLALIDGDVPIGAIVLDPTGHVVGRGHNRRLAAHVGDDLAAGARDDRFYIARLLAGPGGPGRNSPPSARRR